MKKENGQGRMMVRKEVLPGFRFHPTDSELIIDYLRKKVYNQPLRLNNDIYDVEINKYTPRQLFDNYMRKGEAAMYFFTPRDRKYPNGNRPNRAAVGGFWKATASKHAIVDKNNRIGYRSALVYHRGTPKESTKTDWLMQEYTLPDNTAANIPTSSSSTNMKLNTFVLCKIYRKSTKLMEPSTSSAAPPLQTTSPQTPPVLPLQQTNYHHQYEQMLPVLPLQAINDHHGQTTPVLPLQAINDHHEQMPPVLPLQTNDHHEHHSQLPDNVGFSFHDDQDNNLWFGDNLLDFSYDPLVDSLLNDINLPPLQLSNNDSLLKDDNLPNPLPSFRETDFDLPPSQLLSDSNNFLPPDDTTSSKHGRELPTPGQGRGWA